MGNLATTAELKILITGSNGLLGQKIVKQLLEKKIPFLATSKGENRNSFCPVSCYQSLDITDPQQVKRTFRDYLPTHIIHTAAITNVDDCELHPAACHLVNTRATEYLADAASEIHAHFQLLSTDFVFDGEKGNYSEEDPVSPLSVYATSKVNAEEYVRNLVSANWSIVRTIIVYGTAQNLSRSNIVYWAKDALEKGQKLSIIDDQFRAPTWADDLAWACIKICTDNKKGVFHISGPETMSIYTIVQRIAKYFNYPTENVEKSTSQQLNQPAKRPPKTGFNLDKATRELNYAPKTLEETLAIL